MWLDLWVCIFIPLAVVLAYIEGRKRSIGGPLAFLIFAVLTPLFGFLVVSMFPLKNRRGCNWCGNKYNEAEFCGICGKNAAGEISPWFKPKVKKK